MNPALHRVHFFFIKPKFDDCREVCHLLQRSWAFTAEKSGDFTRVVCQTDASILASGLQGLRRHLSHGARAVLDCRVSSTIIQRSECNNTG